MKFKVGEIVIDTYGTKGVVVGKGDAPDTIVVLVFHGRYLNPLESLAQNWTTTGKVYSSVKKVIEELK